MPAEHVSDATLLERFVHLREEDAFVALVRRHGPAVLNVCRRFLRSEHDVEDVFQSTFLVLALKAPRISWQESAEGWLRDVARRLALHARSGIVRRRGREQFLAEDGPGCEPCAILGDDPGTEADRNDLKAAIDDALEQLPEKYRTPIILCYLEGKTNQEAARQLGWPSGSMSRRLERGRTLLRQRLARQGLALTLGLACLAFAAIQGVARLSRPTNAGRDSHAMIRESMAAFRPQDQDGKIVEAILARLVVGDSDPPDRDRVEELARLAMRTATAIEDYDPGRDRGLWRAATVEMRRSASALARSAREGDRLAMVADARRLDATCVRCHTLFHPEDSPGRPADGFGVWPSARLLDKMN